MSPRLIDHFQNPRNIGDLSAPALIAESANPICGDILRLSVRVVDDCIAEVRYKVRGCAASIAAGSALTELIKGKGAAELEGITRNDIEDALGGLSNESKHASALCIDGVRALLRQL
jgi:nitrogen fixation NifU-like protein